MRGSIGFKHWTCEHLPYLLSTNLAETSSRHVDESCIVVETSVNRTRLIHIYKATVTRDSYGYR